MNISGHRFLSKYRDPLTLSPLAVNFEDPLMTFANNLDPDEAPQNVGLHLRSKLFDIQIIYQQKKWVETMNFLKILKKDKYLKKLPSIRTVLQIPSLPDQFLACTIFCLLWLSALTHSPSVW